MKRFEFFTFHCFFVVFVCFGIFCYCECEYTPAQAKVEPLHPKGIRISIPDEDGITLVAFHVRFNEEFSGLEAGTIARDILRVKKGRWIYEDFTTELKYGDIIYYWLHVVYNGLGYDLLFQEHQVTDFYNRDGTKVANEIDKIQKESGCGISGTKVLDLSTSELKNVCGGQQLLNDEFQRLNLSTWKIIEEFSKGPDYSFSVYRNDRRNVEVDRGNLYLRPTIVERELSNDFVRHGVLTLQKCTGEAETSECHHEARGRYILPPTFSGSIDTSKSLIFLYGKIEIRAKLPKGDWIYPIIALERPEKSSSIYPQLRIASSVGNAVLNSPAGADVSGHVLSAGPSKTSPDDNGPSQNPQRFGTELWSDKYHTYQLEWRKNRIVTKVDNIEYGSFATGSAFDKPMMLRLAVRVGGHTEFPDSSLNDKYGKPWRNVGSQALFDFYNATELWSTSWDKDSKDLKIDYVKIFALE